MTRLTTPKVSAYAALSSLGLFGAIALRRPELAALGAPFAAILVLGLYLARTPDVRVSLAWERDRVLEGDEVDVELRARSERAISRLEVFLALPNGLASVERDNPVAVRVPADEPGEIALSLRCGRWGAFRVGEAYLRARDAFGLVDHEWHIEPTAVLRVYPRPEELRSLLRPLETQALAGNEVARSKGDGLEFADIRAYAPGDRIRRINWRASARRGSLYVNEHHPEQNTDVVLFLDTFAEAGPPGASTLDLAVRATASVAARYLERRDRVGLISFGGVLRWLAPGMGPVQRYRIVDALLETEVVFSYAWRDIEVLPLRTLPPHALVVAVTPLLDARSIGALLNLRARGFDLAVVEVSPVPFTSPGSGEHDGLAYRLWQVRRSELRSRFEQLGASVTEWRDGVPLAAALEEVNEFRRHARRATVV